MRQSCFNGGQNTFLRCLPGGRGPAPLAGSSPMMCGTSAASVVRRHQRRVPNILPVVSRVALSFGSDFGHTRDSLCWWTKCHPTAFSRRTRDIFFFTFLMVNVTEWTSGQAALQCVSLSLRYPATTIIHRSTSKTGYDGGGFTWCCASECVSST